MNNYRSHPEVPPVRIVTFGQMRRARRLGLPIPVTPPDTFGALYSDFFREDRGGAVR